jgi:hypothetical protein
LFILSSLPSQNINQDSAYKAVGNGNTVYGMMHQRWQNKPLRGLAE